MKYNFTQEGIAAFLAAALEDAMEGAPLVVIVGQNTLSVPMYPETFESVDIMLNETLDILNDEYEGDF